MFMGEYRHSLDAKNRLIIPSRFREELGASFVVTRYLEGCLTVYTNEQWNRIAAKLSAIPLTNKAGRQFSRIFLSKAVECEPDSQGQPVGKNKDQNVKKDDERRMIHSDPRFVFRFGLHDQGVSPVIIESQAYLYKYMIYHSAAVLSKQSPGRTSPGTYRFRDL